MNLSNNGLNLIKKYEGCVLEAYKCPAGVLTIGYGHTGKDVKQGMKITQAKATSLLKQDVKKFENHVNKMNMMYGYKFNQNEFDALVSFAFNIGSINQLTANGTRTKKQIAEKIPAYTKAGGVVLEGLVKRRKEEQTLFKKGVKKTSEKKPTAKKKSINTIAKEVIKGLWGDGSERKKKLEKAGYDYEAIQKVVNKLLK